MQALVSWAKHGVRPEMEEFELKDGWWVQSHGPARVNFNAVLSRWDKLAEKRAAGEEPLLLWAASAGDLSYVAMRTKPSDERPGEYRIGLHTPELSQGMLLEGRKLPDLAALEASLTALLELPMSKAFKGTEVDSLGF
jgi:hypothetical protein